MKKIKNRIVFLLIVMIGASLLCGSAYNNPKLNPEENVIYEMIDLTEVFELALKDYHSAEVKFDNHDVVFVSYISDISKNRKTMILKDVKGTEIDISSKKRIDYQQGTFVKAYGKIELGTEKKPRLKLELVHIANDLSVDYDFEYYQGEKYKNTECTMESIADGKIEFLIPTKWTAYEKQEAIGIDSQNGKYYMLNEMKRRKGAECFGILYIDNEKYIKYSSDYGKAHDVEKAIVANIIPEENNRLKTWSFTKFPTKSIKTSYGRSFDYYTTVYNNRTIEFVFTPAQNGMCVLIYVYLDDYSSKNDILYLMRTMNIG